MTKVYIDKEHLIIDATGEFHEYNTAEVSVRRSQNDEDVYEFLNGVRVFFRANISTLEDENSVAYTNATFEAFYRAIKKKVSLDTHYSLVNSFEGVVNTATTWEGEFESQLDFTGVAISVLSDQSGVLRIYLQSKEGEEIALREFPIDANDNEPHMLRVTRPFIKVTFENTSGSNANVSIETILGQWGQLMTPLNFVLKHDTDATTVRQTDFNLEVAQNLRQNKITVRKDGINSDIDTGSVSEDVWAGGGIYPGFPVGVIQNGMLVSDNVADTGVVTFYYLDSETAEAYEVASVTLDGTTPVSTGVNIWRSNYATYDSGSDVAFNHGDISLYHQTTTTNIFWVMKAGKSATQNAAYTVPYGSEMFIDTIAGSVVGSTAGTLNGAFWFREFGKSPILRFPFVLQFGSHYTDPIRFLEKVSGQTDIMPRITEASTNNLAAHVLYRIVEDKIIQ